MIGTMLANSDSIEKINPIYERILQDKDAIYKAVISEIKLANKERIEDLKIELDYLRKEISTIQNKYEKSMLELSKARIDVMRSTDKANRFDQLSRLLSKLIDKMGSENQNDKENQNDLTDYF
ncbi:hypothetical protein OAK17_00740 [Alphaproteobacteria bacterium]|nr:hypothetical protein [Alphaproteobacteria bacterium]